MKNAGVIERMNKIDHIIFDKTGTITTNDSSTLNFEGEKLTNEELQLVKTLIRSSNHPLSRALNDAISVEPLLEKIENYQEYIEEVLKSKYYEDLFYLKK